MKNSLFEELAMDVFDEIDRRDTEASKFLVFKANFLFM